MATSFTILCVEVEINIGVVAGRTVQSRTNQIGIELLTYP